MPFPDDTVDLVVSRGSIFFWDDPAKGLSEVARVLRPGGKAYIGGGAGSGYPKWAAEKLIQGRKEKMQGEEAEKWKRFVELRRPEQMKWAQAAGLTDFQVMGKGAISAEDARAGQGVWLLFHKKFRAAVHSIPSSFWIFSSGTPLVSGMIQQHPEQLQDHHGGVEGERVPAQTVRRSSETSRRSPPP